jgi:hypothetical protein
MSKTIDEMIAELEEAREDLGGDAEVRVAWQQQYPLRGTVERVTVPNGPDPDDNYDEGESAAGQENDGKFLWLAAGTVDYNENPYGPKWAWGQDSEDEW